MRQGWNGRSLDQKQAQGILVAALGVLDKQHQRPQESRRNVL
jgi:hypothetical protein